MIHKHASAKWHGTLQNGKGEISTESGALQAQPYGFNTRFEGAAGTNPEELIASAHAGCFTMALSMVLEKNGIDPTDLQLQTKCTITLEKDGDGFKVSKSTLDFTAALNGADKATFEQALQGAKENCPISKLLNCEIVLNTELTD